MTIVQGLPSINKSEIVEALIAHLKTVQETLVKSAMEAKEAATNEESKAENKYDTRGLEASYLAGAQALRAAELSQGIIQLEQIQLKRFERNETIQVTAFVKVISEEDEDKFIFLSPAAGGTKLHLFGTEVLVITPTSPFGRALIGKRVGDEFELKTPAKKSSYEILAVS